MHIQPCTTHSVIQPTQPQPNQVWDVRRLAGTASGRKPLAVSTLSALRHPKSSQSATWAPDGSGRLLSVSFDDTLRVWGAKDAAAAASPQRKAGKGGAPAAAALPTGRGMDQLVSMKHDNQTGRWVIPFRPSWWGGGAVIVGDMKRGVAVFDAATGARVGLKTAPEVMTAIPSRLAAWGAGAGGDQVGRPMLAAATNSGRVHVFR
jgi:hypothetical protein